MNATVLDGARIGRQSIVAAGAVVPQGMEVPEGSLVAGVPAVIRQDAFARETPRIAKVG